MRQGKIIADGQKEDILTPRSFPRLMERMCTWIGMTDCTTHGADPRFVFAFPLFHSILEETKPFGGML